MALTTPDSIRSQKTSPILPTVNAPDSVITTKQSLSRAICSKTSAASPICRPVNAVSPMARTSSSTVRHLDKSSGNIGRSLSFTGSWRILPVTVFSRCFAIASPGVRFKSVLLRIAFLKILRTRLIVIPHDATWLQGPELVPTVPRETETSPSTRPRTSGYQTTSGLLNSRRQSRQAMRTTITDSRLCSLRGRITRPPCWAADCGRRRRIEMQECRTQKPTDQETSLLESTQLGSLLNSIVLEHSC